MAVEKLKSWSGYEFSVESPELKGNLLHNSLSNRLRSFFTEPLFSEIDMLKPTKMSLARAYHDFILSRLNWPLKRGKTINSASIGVVYREQLRVGLTTVRTINTKPK